jgi:hypothetical protein
VVEVREADIPVVEARVAEARRPDRTAVDTQLFHLPATALLLFLRDERTLLLPGTRSGGYFSAT